MSVEPNFNKRALDLIDDALELIDEAMNDSFARRAATEEAEYKVGMLCKFLHDSDRGQAHFAKCMLLGLFDEQSLKKRQDTLIFARDMF
jgi:hypothetical protein